MDLRSRRAGVANNRNSSARDALRPASRLNGAEGERMARKLSITANNSTFSAYPGQILLDAALDQGIDIPHDCRAGQCGTCLVRMKRGELLGGETAQRGTFHACQARVLSNAEITYETVPAVERVWGLLTGIERLAPDIRGLCIKTKTSMRH